ncbi:MAG: hypothetical protein JXB46_06505 [Candidatus Eisenbacteria bacterium]|nr:hypothetical protein [Candidatus Eisenbacteria bacterium]
MTDTPVSLTDRYNRELLRLSPARRLEMACSMFESAKALALAGIRVRMSPSTDVDERVALFMRLYGSDLTAEQKEGVVARLRAA